MSVAARSGWRARSGGTSPGKNGFRVARSTAPPAWRASNHPRRCAMRQELPGRTDQRVKIDAAMLVEPLVLIGDQHARKLRIDICGTRLQPPQAIRRCESAQKRTIGIHHFGGNDIRLCQRRRKGTVSVFRPPRLLRRGTEAPTTSDASTTKRRIAPPSPLTGLRARPCGRSRCGQKAADDTCLPPLPPDDRKFRASRHAPHRPR